MRNKNFLLLFLFCFLSIELFAQAPIDDDPCSAIPIPVGANCNFTQYTNVNATATSGVANPPCTNYQGGDVWFSAVVPASGSIIFDSNTGTMVNSGMALYTGPCNALTAVACDNNGSANGLMSSITANGLTPGATVYIRMWGVGLNNTGTFSICAKSNVPCTPQGANSGCDTADPFCTDVSYNYCNTTNVPSLGGGGIYGCLFSTPNPAFYYMNVASSGPISFQISQQSNTGVGLDVDFVCWGPFASQAAMCAGLSAANIVACSYSFASVETANIPGALAGQWYMVLITNFSNQQGAINFTQTNTGTAGAGTTNCNILTVTPGACTGGLYNLTGTVQTQSPPVSGTLTITNSCGGSTVINAPFTTNIPFSIPNLCGNGGSCNVTAVFSAGGAPVILPTSYNAPSCNTLTAVAGPCVAGAYVLSGTLTTGCAQPASGSVTITSSCGGSVTLNAPFTNPLNWSLPASNGNGGSCTVTAVYSAVGAPIITPFVFNEPNCCSADVGTFNINVTNGTQTNLANGTTQVVLCSGGNVNITSNNNAVLPPSGCLLCTPELLYAIYTSAGPTGPNPNVDPNWTGYYWTAGDFTSANSGGLSSNTQSGCSPLFTLPSVPGYAPLSSPINTLEFVPITADDGDNDISGSLGHDQNSDGCFDLGNPISITFLNPVSFTPVASCDGTVSIEINGGYPQFFPAVYTITNTGSGTLSTTSVSSGGNVTISGLAMGQAYSFSVNDGNGCISTFNGIYNGLPAPTVSINPSSATVCTTGCVNLNATVNSNVPNGNVTFSSNNCVPIPDGGIPDNPPAANNNGPATVPGSWATSTINVFGFCGSNWTTGQTLIVCLNITHSWDADLNIFLQAPNGVFVKLSDDNGGVFGGVNYTNTCFSMGSPAITGGAAPFSGTFAPEGNFSGFNGTSINGGWKLWIGDDVAIDAGSLTNWSITFQNQNNYSYAWSPALPASLTQNVCPAASTTYTLTVTNSCGCTASATAEVIVSNSINVTVTPTVDTVCSLSGSILTANGATTYTWSPGVGLSSTTGASVTANPIVSTTYTVTGTNASGCTGSATAIIQASPNPIVIVNPITICSGQSGVLNAAGALTYTWAPAIGLSATTGITVTANPLVTTSYTIVGTNSLGCTGQTTAVVTVNLVNAAINPDNSTICSGGCVMLNGTANSNTTSTTVFNTNPVPNVIPENLIGNSSTINIPGPCPGGIVGVNTVVSVCVQIAHGNFGSIDATLTSPNGTTIDLTSDNGAATGGLITLCFSGSAAQSITSMAVATSGTYQPEQNFSLFSGSSLTGNWVMTVFDDLPGNGTGAFINWSITFQNASLTYTWSPSASLSSANIINPTACPSTNTTYTIIVTDACTGCTANATSIVNVNPPPIINVNNLIVCTGSGGGALNANGATTYTWSPATGLNTTTGSSVIANPASSVTYTVVGFDANGCSSSNTAIVTVTPSITPLFTQIAPLCQNAVSPVLPLISTNGIAGTWSPSSINTSSPGTSTYTFTPAPNQCAIPTTMDVTILPLVVPTFPLVPPLCAGDPTPILPSTSIEGITGTWSPAINNTTTTTYTFTPDNPSQCGTTTTLTIVVDPLPFTTPIYHD